MNVIGTVVSVEQNVEIAKNGGGSYMGARLSYRDSNGKLVEQAFHNNVLKFNPKVKTALGNINPGDTVTIVKEKKGDFWNVMDIVTGTAVPDAPAKAGVSQASPAPKSNYETSEERAKKQVYIVRQSSLSAATNLLALQGKKTATKEDVVTLAKYFESYVFDTEYDDGSIYTLPSDDIE